MDARQTNHQRWKIVALLLATGLICAFLLEIGVRAIFAAKVGAHVFLYGIVPSREEQSVQAHGNLVEGRYSKYFAHQVRFDTDAKGNSFTVKMNRHGFRGKDYSYGKRPGVIRIVTLGASSTFGYHSRDDETYPSVMEKLLNEGCNQQEFEVINLGIPHLDSKQIVALFQDEALRLSPDVVTFYEGINDSAGGTWRAPSNPSLGQKLRTFIRNHFLAAQLVREILNLQQQHNKADVAQAETRNVAGEFLSHLQVILDTTRSLGIVFIVATQQAKSSLFETEEIRRVTYASEVKKIRSTLSEGGGVGPPERILLIHSELMDSLRKWASDNAVPLVDVIEATDSRRETLMSWVHLSPEGNRIAARAFVKPILSAYCKSSSAPNRN